MKRAEDSSVTLHQLMLPQHANAFGNVHGGVIMKIVDEAGAIAAMRHAQSLCVTVAIDSMMFHDPVEVGQLLECTATVSYVGRTSVEVYVRVLAANPITGVTTHTNSAYVVYVALDDRRKPCTVPGLLLETDADREANEQGKERQAQRLARGRDQGLRA